MMCEVADMLFGLLARLQIAHRDHMMRLTGEVDRAQDQFHRDHRSVGVAHVSLKRLVRRGQQLGADVGIGNEGFELRADQLVG